MKYLLLLTLSLIACHTVVAQNIVEDEGVGISRAQLEYMVKQWPPQMQQAAANDLGDRLELLSKSLGTDKLAKEFDKLTLEQDGDMYFEAVLMVRDAKRRFMIDRFLRTLELPDMTGLAKERYMTDKDRYALVPEQRISSHILFKCAGGNCDRDSIVAKAEALLTELNAGADFEEMVQLHSEDQGTKEKNGRFERWISKDDTEVSKFYVKGLHEIDQPGDYSELVASEFGFHIIRLDEVKPEHYQSFEEVEPVIMAEIEKEFKKRSLIEYVNGFSITGSVYLNGPELEKVFEQYKASSANEGSADLAPVTTP